MSDFQRIKFEKTRIIRVTDTVYNKLIEEKLIDAPKKKMFTKYVTSMITQDQYDFLIMNHIKKGALLRNEINKLMEKNND